MTRDGWSTKKMNTTMFDSGECCVHGELNVVKMHVCMHVCMWRKYRHVHDYIRVMMMCLRTDFFSGCYPLLSLFSDHCRLLDLFCSFCLNCWCCGDGDFVMQHTTRLHRSCRYSSSHGAPSSIATSSMHCASVLAIRRLFPATLYCHDYHDHHQAHYHLCQHYY